MTPENTFSFRMFDLYRRFVEIIKINEEFLKEFKTGFPSEEVCQAIITKTFQHRQPDDKMANMVDYLRKNAAILVAHAENLPETWSTAVRYTNWCISEIKRYLKNKSISIKSNFEGMPDLAKEIGKCIYKNGANPKQIQIIEEYLKEDIRNPKRSIICAQKSKKCKHKEKILGQIPEKKKQVIVLENEESNSVVSVVQDESNDAVHSYSVAPVNVQECSAPQNFFKEDLLKTEFTAEIEDLLQPQGHQSANELLHIASPGESNDSVLQKKDLIESDKSDKTDTCDVEEIQSILESSKCENEDSDFIILEVREGAFTPSKSKAEYFSNTTSSNYYVTNISNINANKRRLMSNDEPINYAKKLFMSNNELNNENTQYITVSTDNNVKDSTWDSVQYVTVSTDDNLRGNTCDSVQMLETTGNKSSQINENHDSSSEYNVDHSERNKKQNNKNQTEVNKIMDISEIKVEPDIKEESGSCNCDMEFQRGTSYIKETVKYCDVMNMTYTEVLKMMEKILAFCELKNEISLEEFLVLRRTRDKMQWRSLKEKSY